MSKSNGSYKQYLEDCKAKLAAPRIKAKEALANDDVRYQKIKVEREQITQRAMVDLMSGDITGDEMQQRLAKADKIYDEMVPLIERKEELQTAAAAAEEEIKSAVAGELISKINEISKDQGKKLKPLMKNMEKIQEEVAELVALDQAKEDIHNLLSSVTRRGQNGELKLLDRDPELEKVTTPRGGLGRNLATIIRRLIFTSSQQGGIYGVTLKEMWTPEPKTKKETNVNHVF